MGGFTTVRRGPESALGGVVAARRTIVRLVLLWSALGSSGFARAAVEKADEGYRFSYTDAKAGVVSLAGSFNGWVAGATPMYRSNDVWSVVVALSPGEYEYKFVVDTQWVADPDNPTTVGEYGNSALEITADGAVAALKPTSNTTLSPKIQVGGRAIALYEYRDDAAQDRYELDRPSLDFDLAFDVRINEDLDAHLVTNVNNESENVEFYQTRLNFDRGSLTLDNPDLFLQAWDNEGVKSWQDPLHLIGSVGIYDHLYGYGTVGMRARKEIAGFEAELLYSDDASEGSTTHPAIGADGILDRLDFDENGRLFRIANAPVFDYGFFDTSHQKDVFAARVARDLGKQVGRPLTVQGLFRLDRGSRPGAFGLLKPDADDPTRTTGTLLGFANTFEHWMAGGGNARYQASPTLVLDGQLLVGRSWIAGTQGVASRVRVVTGTGDEPEPSLEVLAAEAPSKNDAFDLDTSVRSHLGARWAAAPLGLAAYLAWEFQDHGLTPFATELDSDVNNDLSIYRVEMSRSWKDFPRLGRAVKASLGAEFFDFFYDARTPWSAQLWFADRNFWLEAGEDDVSYERLTLVGGRDAIIWKPGFDVRIHEAREIDLAYRGTVGAEGIDKKPKYFESLLQARGRLVGDWAMYFDQRIARYDVPVLDLAETYGATFVELAYEPAPGVSLAFSWGVDPIVIDTPVNEYAYIGRDAFLFQAGANAAAARTGFLDLGRSIREAEEALRDERRIQFEARLNF